MGLGLDNNGLDIYICVQAHNIVLFVKFLHFCQARVQSPNRKPTKSLKEEKKKGFGLRGDTIITWAICGCHIFFSFFIQLSNKLLTLGIALYRFILVLGSSLVWTQYQRKVFEKLILLTILLISVRLTGWAVYYRDDYRYFLGTYTSYKPII